jgi:hypothetical protein
MQAVLTNKVLVTESWSSAKTIWTLLDKVVKVCSHESQQDLGISIAVLTDQSLNILSVGIEIQVAESDLLPLSPNDFSVLLVLL